MLTEGELEAPCVRLDVDVAEGVPGVAAANRTRQAHFVWILVRIFTEPVGIVMLPLPATGLSSRQVAETIDSSLGAVLKVRAAEAGATWPGLTPGAPLAPTSVPPFVASRDAVLAQAPVMTAVICTRERPLGLKACLDSLMQQHYPDYSVLVVDNAPATDASSRVVSEMQDRPVSVKYVVEPRRGLAWARNCALEMVPSGITAWIDDDEVADRYWLAELARGFAEHPDAAAVSGIMLPAELETQAQVWFEQYGGHHKHREFISTAFSPLTAAEQSPLYPLPPFGTGGNMALRADALKRAGGFVTALGAGTWTMGGEDTRLFSELLLGGGTVVYQPSAVTHHYHRRRKTELRRQMFGYGVGLTAFYADLVAARPTTIAGLLRLVPRVIRDSHGPQSLRSGGLPPDFPSDLRWSNRIGLLAGPLRYVLARVVAHRQASRIADSDGGTRR